MRIGNYRRVSTRHQIDNERYLRASADMAEVIERFGGEPVPYDEGGHGRSGATIRGRKVFEAMLADVALPADDPDHLDGIAAPDVRSLSRGEWMIDGKVIADTLIKAGATLITRDGPYNLRKSRDLRAFQDKLYWAMQERTEIRRRFYEGQAARARNTVEGRDQPWARHRTMLGYWLEPVLDDQGRPRITARGVAKRYLAKDPAQAEYMETLIRELGRQHTRGALFRALWDAGVPGPEPGSGNGGWNKRGLAALLNSGEHQGSWALVENTKSDVWYDLDPRQEEFDAARLTKECPELRYWTPAQAKLWREKFLRDDDLTRRVQAGRCAHAHPLLGLLRCPQCHRTLVAKGKFGYICPVGARGTKTAEPCLPMFTVRDSTAALAMRELLPLLVPHLEELTDQARAALRQRAAGGLEIRLLGLDNEERALLAQLKTLAQSGLPAPESFTERLIELGQERQRVIAEQEEAEQVGERRKEAERVLAGITPSDAVEVLNALEPATVAEVYRAFVDWAEVRANGPGRVGGQLVDYRFHNLHTAGHTLLMETLADVFGAAS